LNILKYHDVRHLRVKVKVTRISEPKFGLATAFAAVNSRTQRSCSPRQLHVWPCQSGLDNDHSRAFCKKIGQTCHYERLVPRISPTSPSRYSESESAGYMQESVVLNHLRSEYQSIFKCAQRAFGSSGGLRQRFSYSNCEAFVKSK
ncbi:hypothetical protein PENTCL1PPCAC_24388, partial [Pristionchus entomophagus]